MRDKLSASCLPASFASVLMLALLVEGGTSRMTAQTSAAPAQDAPTASLPSSELDAQWIKASSKYDGARAEILAKVARDNAAGPFTPDWDTLVKVETPDWYKDAKFGIFIHWGVYSVPAFGSEWYPRNMYMEGSKENLHQVATYGPLTKFGYKDFIPMFKAAKYDPQAWARLFKNSGAKYVVPVFEHHDGFTMYDSSLSDWTAVKMGPHRDLVGDLGKAVRAEGLHLGASSHRVEHDWFLEGGRKVASDVNDPAYAAFYGPAHHRIEETNDDLQRDFTAASPEYLNDWLARASEIVDKYHPDIMYFDWWIGQPMVRPYLARFASYYYDESTKRGGPVGVINYKFHAMEEGSGILDLERGQLEDIRKLYWQTDTSISNDSWGYIEHDTFKTPGFIVHQLADIVSKNGNLLMNIGPRPDGTIPEEVQKVLLSVGDWLKINGDAIYGTRPWKVYGEGPTKVAGGSFHDADNTTYTAKDFRFTTKGSAIYAIEMAVPEGQEAVIQSMGTSMMGTNAQVKRVTMLGSTEPVKFTEQADGLHLTFSTKPLSPFAVSFKVEMQ